VAGFPGGVGNLGSSPRTTLAVTGTPKSLKLVPFPQTAALVPAFDALKSSLLISSLLQTQLLGFSEIQYTYFPVSILVTVKEGRKVHVILCSRQEI